jgi:hypothetical protein
MAAPGPMPVATDKNKGLWVPFKNLHASFFAAAQQAKKDGNEALEDRLLTTPISGETDFLEHVTQGFLKRSLRTISAQDRAVWQGPYGRAQTASR